jgi:hypothetical protein
MRSSSSATSGGGDEGEGEDEIGWGFRDGAGRVMRSRPKGRRMGILEVVVGKW